MSAGAGPHALILRFMFDTDTCSYIVKRSHDIVLNRLQSVPTEEVCISVITKTELLFGADILRRRQIDGLAVDAFIHHIAVFDFLDQPRCTKLDHRISTAYRCTKRAGEQLVVPDALIQMLFGVSS